MRFQRLKQVGAVFVSHVCVSMLVHAEDVSFQAVDSEETRLTAIMRNWHDDELKRQGGKFQSHGWWPWGLRAFDFDRDGDLDLIASHHGKPGSIIIESQFRSTGRLTFLNATSRLEIDGHDLPGADDRPWIWDIDGDGFPDIGGMSDESTAPVVLNKGGKAFKPHDDVSLKPLAHPHEILDLDGDGWLDVDGGYRGQWLFQPTTKSFRHLTKARFDYLALAPPAIRNTLSELKKEKNNRFMRSMAMTHMLNGYDTLGYSPTPIDLNADGNGDLVIQTSGGYGADYLGNYFTGSADGAFNDAAGVLGLPTSGAPIWIDDLTGDGYPDILIVGKDTGGVYTHNGRDGFERVDGPLTAFLQKRGPYLLRAFRIDADNDSDWDLVMTNPRLGRVEVFENRGGGTFESLFKTRGWDSNSSVIADMNNDGRMDIVVGTRDRANQAGITIFLNQTSAVGNFARVTLTMPAPNPFAVGAVLTAVATGKATARHVEKAHWDGTPIHIGLGSESNWSLHVRFPDGEEVSTQLEEANGDITVDHSRGVIIRPRGRQR